MSVAPALDGKGRDRRIPRAHWPASLAELVSSMIKERFCLKKMRWRLRRTPDLWPPRAHVYMHTYTQEQMQHTHTYTYTYFVVQMQYSIIILYQKLEQQLKNRFQH